MLSSDSEPGTPQKPIVRESSSSSDSDSDSGSPVHVLDKGGLSYESRYVYGNLHVLPPIIVVSVVLL